MTVTNRKSYMGFPLQLKSMTLNDFERGRSGRLLSVILTSCSWLIEYFNCHFSSVQKLMIAGPSKSCLPPNRKVIMLVELKYDCSVWWNRFYLNITMFLRCYRLTDSKLWPRKWTEPFLSIISDLQDISDLRNSFCEITCIVQCDVEYFYLMHR